MCKENAKATEHSQARHSVIGAGKKLSEEAAPYWVSAKLPWRRHRTAYRVFLAEFLLVRTHTKAVADIFEDVVAKYPDLESLAAADEIELADDLATLGLRKRSPLLIRAAQHLVQKHEGRVPEHIGELTEVPGLGLYTAVAIAAFAYDSAEVPADVNILRFLSRLTGLPMEHPTKGSKVLRELLPFLSRDAGGPSSESLLDFSRTVCRPVSPKCSDCLLSGQCAFHISTTGEDRID
jgi:A/G-specific adenine glycosylase